MSPYNQIKAFRIEIYSYKLLPTGIGVSSNKATSKALSVRATISANIICKSQDLTLQNLLSDNSTLTSEVSSVLVAFPIQQYSEIPVEVRLARSPLKM
jgi:pectin methylesterase-like acyl-CoA thioesterase